MLVWRWYTMTIEFAQIISTIDQRPDTTDPVPVNMCAKINHDAEDNGVVIGGDLYHAVRSFEEYYFKEREGFSIGLKNHYPVYSVRRK